MFQRAILALGVLLLMSLELAARPLVIAHRGGSKLAPENTLAAFRNAVKLGADGFELDIHLTKDGRLIVIHDDTVDRTTDGKGPIRGQTLAELQRYDAGKWFGPKFAGEHLPSLDDVLELAGPKTRVVIEIKQPNSGPRYDGLEAKLVELLRRKKKINYVFVISFDVASLEAVHKLEPKIVTGLLHTLPVDTAKARGKMGLGYLGPYYRVVTAGFIKQAHEHGLKVNPWTVNDEADLKRLTQDGVDAITTDRPDLLLRLLGPR